jgi:hypothetical protein
MNDSFDRDVEVFAEALQLPADQRAAFLKKACAGDSDQKLTASSRRMTQFRE